MATLSLSASVRLPRHRRHRSRWLGLLVVPALAAVSALLGASAPAQALSGSTRLHDPSAITVGSCTYAFSTGFENDPDNPTGAVTEYKSCAADMASGWTKVGNVWNAVPSWIPAEFAGTTPPNYWAPDINYWNGTYYLYYAASLWGTANAATGLLTATNIEGPWTDRGMVTDVNYPIDANAVQDAGGVRYLSWGSWTGPNQATYLHVLDPGSGKLSTTDNNLWTIARNIENGAIWYQNGYYYLFGSKGLCCSGVNSTYYTVVGRSTSITGPYLDRNGTAMTTDGGTTVLQGDYPKVAAGGGDVFTDGANAYFAYHYYDAGNNGQETLDIRPLSLTADGWPVLGVPTGVTQVKLLNANSGMCADLWGLNPANGAPIDQGNCNSGANQLWTLNPVGSGYTLVNASSGKCLEMSAYSKADGTAATQYTCNGGANQVWRKTAVIGGYVTFTNANSGKCLEVYGNSTANGAGMNQWTCNGGANQRWQLG